MGEYCGKRIAEGKANAFEGLFGRDVQYFCSTECKETEYENWMHSMNVPGNFRTCEGRMMRGKEIEYCTFPVIGYSNDPGYCSFGCYKSARQHPNPKIRETVIPLCEIVMRHKRFMESDQRKKVEEEGFSVKTMSDYLRDWVRLANEFPPTIDPFDPSSTSYIENLCLEQVLLGQLGSFDPNSITGIQLAAVREELKWAVTQSKSSQVTNPRRGTTIKETQILASWSIPAWQSSI